MARPANPREGVYPPDYDPHDERTWPVGGGPVGAPAPGVAPTTGERWRVGLTHVITIVVAVVGSVLATVRTQADERAALVARVQTLELRDKQVERELAALRQQDAEMKAAEDEARQRFDAKLDRITEIVTELRINQARGR